MPQKNATLVYEKLYGLPDYLWMHFRGHTRILTAKIAGTG